MRMAAGTSIISPNLTLYRSLLICRTCSGRWPAYRDTMKNGTITSSDSTGNERAAVRLVRHSRAMRHTSPAAASSRSGLVSLSSIAYQYVLVAISQLPMNGSPLDTQFDGLANAPVWKFSGLPKMAQFHISHAAIPANATTAKAIKRSCVLVQRIFGVRPLCLRCRAMKTTAITRQARTGQLSYRVRVAHRAATAPAMRYWYLSVSAHCWMQYTMAASMQNSNASVIGVLCM